MWVNQLQIVTDSPPLGTDRPRAGSRLTPHHDNIPCCYTILVLYIVCTMHKFGGYNNALVVTCGLTKVTHIFPCTQHITSEETIKTPLEEWFCVYGALKEIDLDEDIRIRSDSSWYKCVLKALNMQVSTWIPYAPMGNPLCNVDFCLGHCFSETKYTPLMLSLPQVSSLGQPRPTQ